MFLLYLVSKHILLGVLDILIERGRDHVQSLELRSFHKIVSKDKSTGKMRCHFLLVYECTLEGQRKE
jgi:hypothetical protein